MPRPLSVDLRTRIVNACATQELSQSEIAELFQVHLKTVEKLWKQWRTTQSLAPKPHSRGRAVRLAPYAEDLRRWLYSFTEIVICNGELRRKLCASIILG